MLEHNTYITAFNNAITFRGKSMKELNKEVADILNAFYTLFPRESIKHLTIEQYALGLPTTKESYSYWLDFKTRYNVGSISGGSSLKFGLYYSKDIAQVIVASKYQKSSDEASMSYIAALLDEVLKYAEHDDIESIDNSIISPTLKFKTLFMYYPDKFMPIFAENHYDYLLKRLGIFKASIKGIARKQMHLIEYKDRVPELKNLSNYEYAHYLYYLFGVPSYKKGEMRLDALGILDNEVISDKKRVITVIEGTPSSRIPREISRRSPYKRNYIKDTIVNLKTGFSGEQLVMDYEVKRLKKSVYAERIEHVSLTDDSLGYDILSFEEDGTYRYIEVKTTKTQITSDGNFYISANELKCAQNKNYWIYYVVDVESDNPKLYLMKNPFKDKQIHLEPISYKVRFKL
ncbi:DUF3883 domain-containing protein [Macrococcus armenti]|uniref:DUF3883 domain-containing protein n=1 Tax=Macrococcus armenti TaxID=2875764 RepID=UPI001CCB07BB|nr:DUF3883 domain-containing protein [Macrococcus armenti]UBH13519.1 DUF3883 domain-containing protein [Macrococcus armenti]